MSTHMITAEACNYFINYFDWMSESPNFEIGDWSLMDCEYQSDPKFGIVASRTLHCAPDFRGRERFFYVETNYGDVVDIRWENTPDRLTKLFN